MKQRALDANGDYAFGSAAKFLQDTPLCVAQAIMTRLKLRMGEWFLDTSDGTAYDTMILGFGTSETRDLAIRTRILDTPGVVQISNYISFVTDCRDMSVVATVDTRYGSVQIATTVA